MTVERQNGQLGQLILTVDSVAHDDDDLVMYNLMDHPPPKNVLRRSPQGKYERLGSGPGPD